MKKFGIILAALALSLGAYAQDKTANQWENEGNEFVQNKQFQQALDAYEQAYAIKGDSLSPKTIFNAGLCAQKCQALDKAVTYFSKAESLDYKPGEAAFQIVKTLDKQGKTDEYVQKLTESAEKYPNGKAGTLLKKELAKYYRSQSLKLFNEGADITKQFAANVSNESKLAELKEQAKAKFNEALPLAEKALEINPEDKGAAQIKDGIAKQIANL